MKWSSFSVLSDGNLFITGGKVNKSSGSIT